MENDIRPIALGRRNWLFAGSDRGGETAAVLFSTVSSAKRNNRNVFDYLKDLIAQMSGGTSSSPLETLLPDRWQPSLVGTTEMAS
ncbi:MAG: transposase [Gemmataceae bacterium]